jgi:hypothetical protein
MPFTDVYVQTAATATSDRMAWVHGSALQRVCPRSSPPHTAARDSRYSRRRSPHSSLRAHRSPLLFRDFDGSCAITGSLLPHNAPGPDNLGLRPGPVDRRRRQSLQQAGRSSHRSSPLPLQRVWRGQDGLALQRECSRRSLPLPPLPRKSKQQAEPLQPQTQPCVLERNSCCGPRIRTPSPRLRPGKKEKFQRNLEPCSVQPLFFTIENSPPAAQAQKEGDRMLLLTMLSMILYGPSAASLVSASAQSAMSSFSSVTVTVCPPQAANMPEVLPSLSAAATSAPPAPSLSPCALH